MKLIDLILQESVIYDETIINNQRFKSKYSARTDNFDEFIGLIQNLPDSIESLKVQTTTDSNSPQADKDVIKLDPQKNPMWREKAIELLTNTLKAIEKAGQEPIEFSVKSYYGAGPKEADAPFYTKIQTKQSRQRGKDIAGGGGLDEDAIEDTHKEKRLKVAKYLKAHPDCPHKDYLLRYIKIKDPIEANSFWINHIKGLPITL